MSYLDTSQCAGAWGRAMQEIRGGTSLQGVENFRQTGSLRGISVTPVQRDSRWLPSTCPQNCPMTLDKIMGLENGCHLSLPAEWGYSGVTQSGPQAPK